MKHPIQFTIQGIDYAVTVREDREEQLSEVQLAFRKAETQSRHPPAAMGRAIPFALEFTRQRYQGNDEMQMQVLLILGASIREHIRAKRSLYCQN